MNPILTKIFSAGAGEVIKNVGNVVDNLITSKEEKEQLKIELTKEINRNLEAQAAEANKEISLYFENTKSARDSNKEIQLSDKASFWAKNTAYFLDVFIGLIWGAITIFLIAKALKLATAIEADMTAVLSIYATVTAIFMTCVNFHRGTSIGSQQKQKMIDKMIDK